jgi:LPXTG-motif cell wall-anchored protein
VTTSTVPENGQGSTTSVPAQTSSTLAGVTTSTTSEGGQGSTTSAPTGTTAVNGPTTTTSQPGATVTSSPVGPLGGPTPTTPPGPGNLPRTGSNSSFPILVGIGCLFAGALLAVRKRRSWNRL